MDKTVKINVDGSEAGRIQASIRRDSEQLARDMIRSSRQYSTSAKEVLKDVEDQIKAIEKRNKLDSEFRRMRLESLRDSGGISDSSYSNQKAGIATENRQDELQTRLLRELIDTVKQSSKEEIRGDRRNIEGRIGSSKTVGRLGVTGDEFVALKETVQKGILSDIGGSESSQAGGFNMARMFSSFGRYGAMAGQGNVHGLAMGASGEALGMMAGRGMLSAGSSMGGAGMAAGGAAAVILAGIAAFFKSNQVMFERSRNYMISTQGTDIRGNFNRFKGGNFDEMAMTPTEAMDFYAGLAKSSGGNKFSVNQTRGYAGLTRSRDISPELLNQVIGMQRYSGNSSAIEVVNSFEQALSNKFGSGDEFKRKLVQLPEMMGVYNSLAQTMLQTTGNVNSGALAGFVGGVAEGFGVEGQNLQRYSGGLMRGMSTSGNNFIRKMQFASIRQAYGDKSYQESLEILENPTANKEYMRSMYSNMQRMGLPAFRSWVTRDMGLGVGEAGKMFSSKDEFEKALSSTNTKGNKTMPTQAETLDKYFQEAQKFYGKSEKITALMQETMQALTNWMGETMEKDVENGTVSAIQKLNKSGISSSNWVMDDYLDTPKK